MSFLMAVETLDLRDDFLVFLDGVGIGTCCESVMATTTSLALGTRNSLVLVFIASLTLVGRNYCCLPLDMLAERVSVDLVYPKSLSSFFAGLFP